MFSPSIAQGHVETKRLFFTQLKELVERIPRCPVNFGQGFSQSTKNGGRTRRCCPSAAPEVSESVRASGAPELWVRIWETHTPKQGKVRSGNGKKCRTWGRGIQTASPVNGTMQAARRESREFSKKPIGFRRSKCVTREGVKKAYWGWGRQRQKSQQAYKGAKQPREEREEKIEEGENTGVRNQQGGKRRTQEPKNLSWNKEKKKR